MSTTALRTFAEYRAQPDFGCSVPHEFDSWLIAPCGQNRDSDSLTRSNWEVQQRELEKLDESAAANHDDYTPIYEIHRFGHWACGWVELAIVKPGTTAAEYAQELADALADYPVADESHHSELEWNEAAESWESYGASDFKRALRAELDASVYGAKFPAISDWLDDVPTNDQLREFLDVVHPNYGYEFDCGGCNFPIEQAVKNCQREQMAAFVRKVRAAK